MKEILNKRDFSETASVLYPLWESISPKTQWSVLHVKERIRLSTVWELVKFLKQVLYELKHV